MITESINKQQNWMFSYDYLQKIFWLLLSTANQYYIDINVCLYYTN